MAVAIKQKKQPTRAAAPVVETANVKVRATRLGFYEYKRRRVGDVFVMACRLVGGEAEIPSWCETAERTAALKETGSQAALDAEAAAQRLTQGAQAAASTDDLGI